MLPEEVYKRRHFGTPQSFFLIMANYIVLVLAIQFFAMCAAISLYFWISMALLAAYNVYKIRREREEYDKPRIIAYAISLAGLVLMFFVFRSGAGHC